MIMGYLKTTLGKSFSKTWSQYKDNKFIKKDFPFDTDAETKKLTINSLISGTPFHLKYSSVPAIFLQY